MTKERKGKYKIIAFSEKQKAVELLKSGKLPIAEIAAKYGVNTGTISVGWVKQVELGIDRLQGGYKIPTNEFRLKVVRSVLAGNFTVEEAARAFQIREPNTIVKWMKRFGSEASELGNGEEELIMKQRRVGKKVKSVSSDSDKEKSLEQALSDAKLKILALETMITIAEDQFKIDIRKKSGTKQSEQ